MTKDKALRLALEALEDLGMKHYESTGEVLYKETFTAIKTALEAKDEPYAFEASMYSNDRVKIDPVTGNVSIGTPQRTLVGLTDEKVWEKVDMREHAEGNLGIGTAPPLQRKWVGLTDAEVDQAFTELTLRKMYQAIEAKLKEKNT